MMKKLSLIGLWVFVFSMVPVHFARADAGAGASMTAASSVTAASTQTSTNTNDQTKKSTCKCKGKDGKMMKGCICDQDECKNGACKKNGKKHCKHCDMEHHQSDSKSQAQ